MSVDKSERAGVGENPLRRGICCHALTVAGKLLLILCLAAMIVGLYGCGGSGSDSGDDGDADPLAPEISSQVDGFVNAVNSGKVVGNDPSCAMYYIDSNIKYYRAGLAATSYASFRDYLQAFVDSSSKIRFSIDDRKFTSNGESWALCAGTLNCTWTDAGDTAKTLSEPVQIEWQRVSRWGILKLSRYDVTGLQFPPSP